MVGSIISRLALGSEYADRNRLRQISALEVSCRLSEYVTRAAS